MLKGTAGHGCYLLSFSTHSMKFFTGWWQPNKRWWDCIGYPWLLNYLFQERMHSLKEIFQTTKKDSSVIKGDRRFPTENRPFSKRVYVLSGIYTRKGHGSDMIGSGRMPFGGSERNRRYSSDDDWEVSDELSPDPFAEEEHSRIHGSRFLNRHQQPQGERNLENHKKSQNQE